MCSIGFKSRDCAGHSKTQNGCFPNHSQTNLVVCMASILNISGGLGQGQWHGICICICSFSSKMQMQVQGSGPMIAIPAKRRWDYIQCPTICLHNPQLCRVPAIHMRQARISIMTNETRYMWLSIEYTSNDESKVGRCQHVTGWIYNQ